MKPSTFPILSVLASVLLLAVAGCATSRESQTVPLLRQAGFKPMPASTFEKQQHLKTLKPDVITTVKGTGGQLYYVYPLHAQDLLYVGRAAEYTAYNKLQASLQSQEATLKAESSSRENTSWSLQSESSSSGDSGWEDVWSAPPN